MARHRDPEPAETMVNGSAVGVAVERRARPQRAPAGPFDADSLEPDAQPVAGTTDFGAIQVLLPANGAVSIEPPGAGGTHALHVALPDGRLSMSALAAPKSSTLWPELAKEIESSLKEGGARVRSFTGEWGRELHATTGAATSVFVGVDGPRWMLYGVATGPTTAMVVLDAELRRMLRGTVVARGSSPYPVRTVLPLTLPAHLAPPEVDGPAEPGAAAEVAEPGAVRAGERAEREPGGQSAPDGRVPAANGEVVNGSAAAPPAPVLGPRAVPAAAQAGSGRAQPGSGAAAQSGPAVPEFGPGAPRPVAGPPPGSAPRPPAPGGAPGGPMRPGPAQVPAVAQMHGQLWAPAEPPRGPAGHHAVGRTGPSGWPPPAAEPGRPVGVPARPPTGPTGPTGGPPAPPARPGHPAPAGQLITDRLPRVPPARIEPAGDSARTGPLHVVPPVVARAPAATPIESSGWFDRSPVPPPLGPPPLPPRADLARDVGDAVVPDREPPQPTTAGPKRPDDPADLPPVGLDPEPDASSPTDTPSPVESGDNAATGGDVVPDPGRSDGVGHGDLPSDDLHPGEAPGIDVDAPPAADAPDSATPLRGRRRRADWPYQEPTSAASATAQADGSAASAGDDRGAGDEAAQLGWPYTAPADSDGPRHGGSVDEAGPRPVRRRHAAPSSGSRHAAPGEPAGPSDAPTTGEPAGPSDTSTTGEPAGPSDTSTTGAEPDTGHPTAEHRWPLDQGMAPDPDRTPWNGRRRIPNEPVAPPTSADPPAAGELPSAETPRDPAPAPPNRSENVAGEPVVAVTDAAPERIRAIGHRRIPRLPDPRPAPERDAAWAAPRAGSLRTGRRAAPDRGADESPLVGPAGHGPRTAGGPGRHAAPDADDSLVASAPLPEEPGADERSSGGSALDVSARGESRGESGAVEQLPAEPATSEPATGEPATGEPATSEPATSEPATSEPATSEPATSEPATGERAAGAPADPSRPAGRHRRPG